MQPSEITILTYDALGLIYYIWNKKNYKITVNERFYSLKIILKVKLEHLIL